jgi:hypothetical protein
MIYLIFTIIMVGLAIWSELQSIKIELRYKNRLIEDQNKILITVSERMINAEPTKSKRELAIDWWEKVSPEVKQIICESPLLTGYPRKPSSLTGREIESLYDNRLQCLKR